MSRYNIKIYESCPIPTILWNVVGLTGCVSAISGLLCLYYVFFPTEETNQGFVLAGAIICIPLFVICLLLRKPIDKLGEKQLKEKSKGEEQSNGQGARASVSKRKVYARKSTYTIIALGMVMIVFIFCIFYNFMRK